MLFYGTRITVAGDRLLPLEPARLFASIREPKESFADQIRQLRALRTLDPNRYRETKKHLPYFVCSAFHPPVRKKEHFASVSYLVIDLDHLDDHAVDGVALREKLREDPRVLGYFASPGGDGLKVMYRLKEPCLDSARFSVFYKMFAAAFAREHQVAGCLDAQTHDVTRACFLSWDPDAWFHPDAIGLDMDELLPEKMDIPDKGHLKEVEKDWEAVKRPEERTGPDNDVLRKIREKLQPNMRRSSKPEYFVPEEVDKALEIVGARLPEFGLILKATEAIQYGRKLRVEAPGTLLWAEINLFYGRKGYSLFLTTKSGSNQDLGKLAVEALAQIIDS